MNPNYTVSVWSHENTLGQRLCMRRCLRNAACVRGMSASVCVGDLVNAGYFCVSTTTFILAQKSYLDHNVLTRFVTNRIFYEFLPDESVDYTDP